MRSIRLRDATVLGDNRPPYIVAEMNTSHFGSIETARRMIEKAREAGCDCVKFQSWSAESLYSRTFYLSNPIAERFVKKFAFSADQLADLANFCSHCGIAFCSTPYSHSEVDVLLDTCKAPYIKVASMDLNNYPFLDYVARTGAPIVLSTGMGDMDEIRKAVRTIEQAGNRQLCLLHCISIYPPELSTIRLKNILGLQEEFADYPIGFSDHSIGIEIASAAVALGACLIEKHFSLDNTKIGMDNQIALEPVDLARLVRNCHNVQKALGDKDRVVLPAEIEQRKKMRRSIVSAKPLKAGSILRGEDLDFKRPGYGLPPGRASALVGKTLLRDVDKDMLITEAEFTV